jgi:hypothetical protein
VTVAEPVSVEVEEVTRETDKAILVVVDGDEEWIPKSVIDDDSEVHSMKSGRDGGTMLVAEWFARSKGWV